MFVLHAWRWYIVIRSLFDIVQIMRAYIMQLRIALGMNIDSYSGPLEQESACPNYRGVLISRGSLH